MTIEEMDAEIEHMKDHNARLKSSVVAELEAQLLATPSAIMRAFYERELAKVKAIGVPEPSPNAA